jgi:hypothetical protein
LIALAHSPSSLDELRATELLLQRQPRLGDFIHARRHALQAIEHIGQGVIDLVRHASSQHPHAREAVGLGQLVFQPFALGDVFDDGDKTASGAGL